MKRFQLWLYAYQTKARWKDERMKERMTGWQDDRMKGWKDKRMYWWKDEKMNRSTKQLIRWLNRFNVGCTNGWLNRFNVRCMNGWINKPDKLWNLLLHRIHCSQTPRNSQPELAGLVSLVAQYAGTGFLPEFQPRFIHLYRNLEQCSSHSSNRDVYNVNRNSVPYRVST